MRIPDNRSGLGDFSMVQMNWIESHGKIVKKFLPNLTQTREGLLRLAGVPSGEYRKDWVAIPGD